MKITKQHPKFIKLCKFIDNESIRPYKIIDNNTLNTIINIRCNASNKTIESSKVSIALKNIRQFKIRINRVFTFDNVLDERCLKKLQRLIFEDAIAANRFSSNNDIWKKSKKDLSVLTVSFLDKELKLLRELYNQI